MPAPQPRSQLARQAIDTEFNTRLASINQALSLHLSLLPRFSDGGQPLAVRSYTHCLEISLASDGLASRQAPPPRSSAERSWPTLSWPAGEATASEAVELWLHAGQGRGGASLLTKLSLWIPPWLALYAANRSLLSELTDEQIRIERQQDWLVLRLRP